MSLSAVADPPAHISQLEATLRFERQSIESFGHSFETQLFNQDVLSTPRLNATLNAHLFTFEGFASLLEVERVANGISGESFTIPPLSGRVAARTPFYQSKISEHIAGQITGQPFPINFATVIPSAQTDHGSYPTSAPPSREHQQCTSGGFFTRSQVPQNVSPSVNLFTDFSRDYDRECHTPNSIRLSLNGQFIEIRCGGSATREANTQNAINEMVMCDPLLYGFHPRALQNPNIGLAACHYPPAEFVGRGRTYSSNISGRNSSGDGFRSHCDLIAEGLVSPALENMMPQNSESDRSLILAAQLAMDNPTLWSNKKTRANQHCAQMTTDNLEYDHCQNILQRIQTIEEIISRMRNGTLFPDSGEIPDAESDTSL